MAVSIGNVLEVTIQSTLLGQQMMTILHYVVGIQPTQQDPTLSQEDVADILNVGGTGDLITKYRACCATNLTINRLTVQYIWPTRYVRAVRLLAAVGTGIGDTNMANISGMLQKVSVFAGRKNRGAIHMPGPPQNEISQGAFIFSQVTLYGTLVDQMADTLTEGGGGVGRWDPYILHRTHPINGTGVVWDRGDVKVTQRVQRRRTLGVGK